ncbi:MAG: hypothetical protein GX616_02235 [Planctomycetes bacterium]|nr:hypothetical protein [Planctomycetota bacterium]
MTAAAFLERKLQQAWPDRRVEVINLGTTAVASFPVVRMTAEALRYEPDLIVACTGHNEFYGACGVASVHAGGSSTMIHLSHAVRKLAIVQAVSGFSRPRAVCHQEDRDALIERMAAEDQIAPNDERRARAVANLSAHLSEIVALCADHRVPLMLCTLPSNERDLAPVGRDPMPPIVGPDQA